MPLANAVKCWECNGEGGEWGYLPVRGHLWVDCPRCHGTGQLCSDCHKPEGVCECVPAFRCPNCGATKFGTVQLEPTHIIRCHGLSSDGPPYGCGWEGTWEQMREVK